MGKTVAELAQACKTSTTTIYRTLQSVQQEHADSSTPLTTKWKGITHFTEEGERIIKECLNAVEQNDGKTSTELNSVERVEHSANDEILFLRRQNETLLQELSRERQESSKDREQNQIALEKEREHSRQQAERLAELSEKLAELTKNEQILMLQNKNTLLLDEQLPDISEGTHQENKKGFFTKFFSKKKDSQ